MEFIKQYTFKILAAMKASRTRLFSIYSSLNSNYTSMTLLLSDWTSQYHNRWCKIAPYLVFLPSTTTHALLQYVFPVWWSMGFLSTYYFVLHPNPFSNNLLVILIQWLKIKWIKKIHQKWAFLVTSWYSCETWSSEIMVVVIAEVKY